VKIGGKLLAASAIILASGGDKQNGLLSSVVRTVLTKGHCLS
jgi:hypothetical protein